MKNYQKPQVQICELQTSVILAGSGNTIKNNAGLVLKPNVNPSNAWDGR